MKLDENELIQERLLELQSLVEQLRSENTVVNRRLSAQNRTGKQLADIIRAATVILSEHVQGNSTGRQSIQKKYAYIGRRRWGWGVALLKTGQIVIDSSNWCLSFNESLTIARAYEKLQSVSKEIINQEKPIAILRPYLPSWQK